MDRTGAYSSVKKWSQNSKRKIIKNNKRTLTVNELKSEVNFSTDEVKKTFIENYNKMHKTKFQSLSSKQKEKVIVTKTVNDYQTEAYLYGQKIFGSFSEFITPLPQNYDGDKALSIFSLKN